MASISNIYNNIIRCIAYSISTIYLNRPPAGEIYPITHTPTNFRAGLYIPNVPTQRENIEIYYMNTCL